MRNWILPALLCVALVGASFGLRAYAYAQGAADVAPLDAGIEDDGFGSSPALSTAPQVVGFNWNPLSWPWETIMLWAFTILGALIAALRPISRLTKWTFDDKVVAKLELLMALLLRVFTPPAVRLKSLSGGKSAGDPPPVAPMSSGGKAGG